MWYRSICKWYSRTSRWRTCLEQNKKFHFFLLKIEILETNDQKD